MLNETAKLPAEAFLGGEFRHGPIELAGPGLTAVLFGSGATNPSLTGLGEDLMSSGSRVVHVDPGPSPVGWLSISTNATGPLGRAICGAKLGQLLSVELARGRGLEPGIFRFGSKVTTSL
jgi:glucosamine--fructose-6-phosphate aminotransferase (isomerizing)